MQTEQKSNAGEHNGHKVLKLDRVHGQDRSAVVQNMFMSEQRKQNKIMGISTLHPRRSCMQGRLNSTVNNLCSIT